MKQVSGTISFSTAGFEFIVIGADPNYSTNSSRSETILTPADSTDGTYRSTYSRQYNVTPTPEREIPHIVDDFGILALSEDGSANGTGKWLYGFIIGKH
jgi:hypothetical protein